MFVKCSNHCSEKALQSGESLVNFYYQKRGINFQHQYLKWNYWPEHLFSFLNSFFFFKFSLKNTDFLCMAGVGTDAVKQKLEESVCSDCWPEGNTGYLGRLRAKELLFQTDQSLQTTEVFLPACLFVSFFSKEQNIATCFQTYRCLQ